MEKKNFVVTENMLQGANTYIPLEKKIRLAKAFAPYCIEKSKTAEQNKIGEKLLALPCLFIDDICTKELYLMQVFIHEYLGIDTGNEFTDEMYDYYAGSHVFNQLEHYKGNIELKPKIFNILSDFKKFKKILDTEIYSERTVRNDPVARIIASIGVMSDPENIKAMYEELKIAAERFKDVQQRAKALKTGDIENEG